MGKEKNNDMQKADQPYWAGKKYSFFSHKECEFFPCHKVTDEEEFNCLFCYCPLYCLGENCGGNFKYTDSGFKDCSDCALPHRKESYGYVISKYQEIIDSMKKK